MIYSWYYNKIYNLSLKELTAEVIASKSARADEQDEDLEVGFLEIFPGLNQYRINIEE